MKTNIVFNSKDSELLYGTSLANGIVYEFFDCEEFAPENKKLHGFAFLVFGTNRERHILHVTREGRFFLDTLAGRTIVYRILPDDALININILNDKKVF